MMAEKTKLEKRLDEHLERALQMKPSCKGKLMPSLLLEGSTGTGKTSITRKWAKDNGVNLCHIQVNLWRGVSKEQVEAAFSEEASLKNLSLQNTILLFDNFDLGEEKTRALFSDLMEHHVLHTPNGELFLPEVLFAIAVVWPSGEGHPLVKEPLTEAEKRKFECYTVDYDKEEYLDYIRKYYSKKIERAKETGKRERVLVLRRRMAIAEHILKHPRFQFKDDHGFPTYSSISRLLDGCDGTKNDFLDHWDSCTHAPDLKPVMEEILSAYSDIEE